jgi:SSS family solute:Na+ symporter
VGTAYLATRYNNIMDLLQLVFGFVNAPLFATFLLGMFWKRATGHGAFWGLLSGTLAAAATHGLTLAEGKGAWIANLQEFPSTMAQNFWLAIIAWTVCFCVTILISLITKPRPDEEMVGLVYSLTPKLRESLGVWYLRPATLAIVVGVACVILNFIFY